MKTIIQLFCLTALFAGGIASCDDKEILEKSTDLPQAAFVTDKTEYAVDEEVHFTSQSTPKNAPIAEYYWHFGFEGQGNNSTEQNPSVTYTRVGRYAVKLTVTDEKGAYATMVDTVIVHPVNQPPVVEFSYTPTIVAINETVNFSNQSTDTDGTVESFAWDFGNGQTSSSPNPSTSYPAEGFYTVSLTVTDNNGATGTKTTSIFVRASIADFGTTLWTTTYENASTIEGTSPAVGNNGDIYVTANAMKLHAVSPSGVIRWSFDLTQDNAAAGKQTSSPIVGPDGVVYIGAGYNLGGNGPGMYAVTPDDGSKKWWFYIWSGARIYYTPPAIASDGNIIIANRGTNGRIHKVNKNSGTVMWVAQPHGGGSNGPTVVDKNGIVYSVMSSVRGIARIDGDGVRMSGLSDNIYYMSSIYPAIDADGTLYVACEQGAVLAYNPATGTSKWETPGYGKFDYSGIAIAAGEPTVYVGSSNGAASKLIALNKTNGSERWAYSVDAAIQSAPAVDANGIIHFADINGNYYALNPDGTLKFKKSIGTRIWSSPVISDYGVLYFTVEDSGACKLVAISINAGPADSPWPQAGQNARRAGIQK
jgi:PKD repeat protein